MYLRLVKLAGLIVLSMASIPVDAQTRDVNRVDRVAGAAVARDPHGATGDTAAAAGDPPHLRPRPHTLDAPLGPPPTPNRPPRFAHSVTAPAPPPAPPPTLLPPPGPTLMLQLEAAIGRTAHINCLYNDVFVQMFVHLYLGYFV